MINTLVELQHLAANRPCATTSAAGVAAWYRTKADLHDHLAAEARDAGAAAGERELARRARQHAAELTLQTALGVGIPQRSSSASATSTGAASMGHRRTGTWIAEAS